MQTTETQRDIGHFSYNGGLALYDHLSKLEKATDWDFYTFLRYDHFELAGEYTEYNNMKDFQIDYNMPELNSLEALREYTTVIKINDDAFIIKTFRG